jgi:hypothetical protein
MSSNNHKERRRFFFALRGAAGTFVIAITLLAIGFELISPITMTAAIAQEGNNTTIAAATLSNSTTRATTSSSGIELSLQPVYQEEVRDVSETLISQTHAELIVSGNGTLTLPNGSETIRTNSTGSGIVSIIGTFAGREILTTEDGSENATATFYEIAQSNKEDGIGKGIAIAVFHTNSTGKLAPLDGMILAGQEEIQPDGTGLTTLWEWQSGIPYVKIQQPQIMQESPMSTNTAILS